MEQVVGEVVLAAADGVDAGIVVIGIRSPGAGLADAIRIEIAMEVQRLAAEAAQQVEHQVLIVIVAIGHRAVVVEARSRGGDAEPGHSGAAGDTKSTLLVSAAFGEDIEVGRGAGFAGDEVDHPRVGILAGRGGLRTANHLDAIQFLGRNVGEIEGPAETIDRNAVDLHQIEIVVAAAQIERGEAAGKPGLADGHPGQITQQVDGLRLVALADLFTGDDAGAAALLAGRDIDGGANHAHRILERRQFQFDRQGLRCG